LINSITKEDLTNLDARWSSHHRPIVQVVNFDQ
jgi:hypothetical protein